jgi:hypothetical protein
MSDDKTQMTKADVSELIGGYMREVRDIDYYLMNRLMSIVKITSMGTFDEEAQYDLIKRLGSVIDEVNLVVYKALSNDERRHT